MTYKLPDTSLEAYRMMTGELLSEHHQKIVDALSVLKRATAEEIAAHIGWDDRNRAARRMSELEREQIVFKPGEKRKTKYGRNSYVYELTHKPKVEKKPLVQMELF